MGKAYSVIKKILSLIHKRGIYPCFRSEDIAIIYYISIIYITRYTSQCTIDILYLFISTVVY